MGMNVSKPLLRSVPLLSCLSDDQLNSVQDSARTVKYPRNTILFSEGDSGDCLFIVLSGRVKVALEGPEGKEIVLTILESGGFLGEMALFDGSSRSATASTLEPSTLLRWSRQDFLNAVLSDRTLAMDILAQLARRVREADDQIRTLALFDIHGRVVRSLLKLARERGTRDRTRILVRPRPSHQMIADMIGCQRETVSRAMKMLEKAGHVKIAGRTLTVERRALQRYWPVEAVPTDHRRES